MSPQLDNHSPPQPALMVFENKMQPAARPRPRGQVCGPEPAREDAGAPLTRHWLQLILKDHQRRSKLNRRSATKKRLHGNAKDLGNDKPHGAA